MTLTDLTGCRAAFYGEVELLLEHLRSCTEEQLLQHDSQGNTVSPNTHPSIFTHAYALDTNSQSWALLTAAYDYDPHTHRGGCLPTVLVM